MHKKIWLIAGIAGMLLGMPQSTIQAEYRGDRFEERGPRRSYDDRRYDQRADRARIERRLEREERRRWERAERRRILRAEERRRLRRLDRLRDERRYERRYERDRRY